MSSALRSHKSERLIVTTCAKSATHTQVWDGTEPLPIGLSRKQKSAASSETLRWILERTDTGVRVRDLLSMRDSVVSVDLGKDPSAFQVLSVPNSQLQLKVRRAKTVRAAFLQASRPPGITGELLPKLFVYSGVRRSVIGANAVHSAHIAYHRGRPAFSVYYMAEGVRIKVLSSKVYLKVKGTAPVMGAIGETWTITSQQMAQTTLTRGYHWWRLNLVQIPMEQESERLEKDSKDIAFGWGMKILAVAMLVAGVMINELPEPVKKNEKEAPVEVAKVIFQKAPEKLKKYVPEKIVEAPKPEPKIEVKHEEVPKPKPKVVVKVTPKPVQKVAKVEKVAPVEKVAKAQVTKVAPPVIAGGAPVKPKVSKAALAAAANAKLLQDALGGAASLIQKDVPQGDAGGAHVAGLFTDSGANLSPTEVKPGFAGTNIKVGNVGNGGTGGTGGGTGNGVGYGSGEHGSVTGQGRSLASIDAGVGATVDEGLTKEEVGAVIHAHMSEIRYCHESAMLSDPRVEGKLVLNFKIDPVGVVETVGVGSTTLDNVGMQACISQRLKTWKFPHPRGGIHVSVSYPFVFKTLGRD